MSGIKNRLHNARAKFLRRSSGTGSDSGRSITSSAGSDRHVKPNSTLRKSTSVPRLPAISSANISDDEGPGAVRGSRLAQSEVLPQRRAEGSLQSTTSDDHRASLTTTTPSPRSQQLPQQPPKDVPIPTACPQLTLEAPTPQAAAEPSRTTPEPSPSSAAPSSIGASLEPVSSRSTPPIPRRQSLVTAPDAKVITNLLEPAVDQPPAETSPPTATDYFGGPAANFSPAMLHRKIWVKRPNASATLVQIREDDLVDDVRDMILRKYANSLGRSFDAPDVTLKVVPRDAANGKDRTLGPEEEMCRMLDNYYPGGQKVNEALIIDVPKPRTPKPSPRVPPYYHHHDDGTHTQTEYFPPMPIVHPSPGGGVPDARMQLPHAPHSIAVLNTGQLPALPSPGGTRKGPHRLSGRPQYPRHNTASPTTLGNGIPSSATSSRPPNRQRHDSSASDTKRSTTSNNPIPTPPAPIDTSIRASQTSNPSTPRIASPQPPRRRPKKPTIVSPSLPAGLLDGSVPPINVLIVEDNIINLRVLGAFMQRLKVRWQRAMNGKEAVTKWKAGGFHLVLMDIQLPVMNGLEATKEIRRLERVNSIGVFSSGSSEAPNTRLGTDGSRPEEPQEDDRLGDKGLFKSPVIIVALTASSLQSDRHEALAAGCNDFLTKVWLLSQY